MCSNILNDLASKFPYCESNDLDDKSIFTCAHVGMSTEQNVLVRINRELKRGKLKYTFGVVDDEKQQFLFNDIDSLSVKVGQIIKHRLDSESKKRTDAVKLDIEIMRLFGFLTKNEIKYFHTKTDLGSFIYIYGTAFKLLTILVKPDTTIFHVEHLGDLTRTQLESFVLNCKEIKDLK